MKRILLTAHKFFPDHRAGTEVLTLKVAQELQRRGYQVAILTANPIDTKNDYERSSSYTSEEKSTYDYEGVQVFSLNETARLTNNRFANEHYHPYLKKHYREVFDSFAPDLVHCLHLQNLSTSLIEEAKARKIPIIYSATDFWLICPIVQLRRPDGSNCQGPAPLTVNCLTCYTPEVLPEQDEFIKAVAKKYPDQWKGVAESPKPVNNFISTALYATYIAKKLPSAVQATMERPNALKHFANQMDAITVPTRLMEQLFLKNGLEAKIIHHIPYGIDTAPLEQGQKKTATDKLRFAFIGNLSEHKGPDLLINAFLELPPTAQAALTLYGDSKNYPEYCKYLHQIVDSSSVSDKITFGGTFPNDEIGEVFSNIDVLVVPSRWYENTPLVMQSAFAAKTPIVATNLGGMAELVKHEINGLLFEPDNVKSLADQLLKLLSDKALLPMLRANIKPERTMVQMVDDLEALYERVIENKTVS